MKAKNKLTLSVLCMTNAFWSVATYGYDGREHRTYESGVTYPVTDEYDLFAPNVFAQTSSSLHHSTCEWQKLAKDLCDVANERTRLWEIALPQPSKRWRASLPFYPQLVLDVIWFTSKIERMDYPKGRAYSCADVKLLGWEENPSLENDEQVLLWVLAKIANSDAATNKMMSYFQQVGIQKKAHLTLHRIREAYQKEYEALKKILETEYARGMYL